MRFPIVLASCFALPGLAVAAEKPTFPLDEAASCAVTYATMFEAMQAAPGVSKTRLRQTNDALAVWEYELTAHTADHPAEMVQARADAAFKALEAGMPAGDGPDGAAARGRYLTDRADACHVKMKAAYGDKPHPVFTSMQDAAVAVTGDGLR